MEQRLQEAEAEFKEASFAYEKAKRELKQSKKAYWYVKGEAERLGVIKGPTEKQQASWDRFRQIVARAKFLYANTRNDNTVEQWQYCMQLASSEMKTYGLEKFVEVFKGLKIDD